MSLSIGRIWVLYYKLFSLTLTLALTWYFYQSNCMVCTLALIGILAYLVYSAIPVTKVKGGENYKAIIIGSGFSGLGTAVKLDELGVPYVLLEKAPELGGTWYENIYPGAACDIPSHMYSLSFFPNPWWSRMYSKQNEIHGYLKAMAEHHNIMPRIQFGAQVTSCDWDEKTKMHTVATKDGRTFTANFVIKCTGMLHEANTPKFEGMDQFKGEQFHSALWSRGATVKNKRVAVVGTGASAVQVVPNIAKDVTLLHVFQRTPPWVYARNDGEYHVITKWLFALIPPLMTLHRWYFFWMMELKLHSIFGKNRGNAGNKLEKQVFKWYETQIKDPKLREKLMPDYSIGCKRITPSDTYLQSYNLSHVHLVTDKLEKFTQNGIRTVSKEDNTATDYEFDTVIFATGFNVMKTFNNFDIRGKDQSTTLENIWGDEPKAYKGTTVPNFPNFFILFGPNCGLSYNSNVFIMENQMNYTASLIRSVIESGSKAIEVQQEPTDKYQTYLGSMLAGTVFTSGCASWYKSARGVDWILWPSNMITLWWNLARTELQNYKIE